MEELEFGVLSLELEQRLAQLVTGVGELEVRRLLRQPVRGLRNQLIVTRTSANLQTEALVTTDIP